MLLNLSNAPTDPVERIIWLDGVNEQVRAELEEEYAAAYFAARLQRRLDTAIKVGRASRKRALAWTRRQNERTGRSVRWNDGADPTSTAYTG
jgi:hypothetical protein